MIVNGKSLFEYEPIKGMSARKDTFGGVSHGLGEAGYDIRLKQRLIFSMDNMGADILRDNELIGGRFVIASAVEEFDMPNNLVGIVHDKSTWARQGVSVFNTVIEPGWKGFLTLEIVFHGSREVIIPAGAGIAQVIFHETLEHRPYQGKYQNQASMPVPAKVSK
jgi:dCTP deaminase